MASSDTTKMAEIDTFVIPQQYAPLMMMFGMASGGKNVITVEQLEALVQKPIEMMVVPQLKLMIENYKVAMVQKFKCSPGCVKVIDDVIAKGLAAVTGDLKPFIQPLFSIVDTNDSGTISKREFFHLMRIKPFVENMKAGKKHHMANAKELLDIVFDLLDTDSDHAISKAEIASYVHRILSAAGKLLSAVIEVAADIVLSKEVFGAVLEDAFSQGAAQLKMMGADIFDDSGNISQAKCAPFLAMGDKQLTQMLKGVMASQTPANMAMMKTYADMEKKVLSGLSAKADAAGNISKADYAAIMMESNKAGIAQMKAQFTAMLGALPAQAQGPAMMVSGFINPVDIFSKIMSATPFFGQPMIDEMFESFGTGDKMNISSIKVAVNMIIGAMEGTPATDRAKAVFGLLDNNSDGAISAKEAARVIGGTTRVLVAATSVIINLYTEFLGHNDFICGLLSAAEAMAPMAASSLPPGVTLPKFPLQKSFFEGMIAKFMGDDNLNDEDIAKFFALLDTDKDGKLSYEEFDAIEPGHVSKDQFLCMVNVSESKVMDYQAFENCVDGNPQYFLSRAKVMKDCSEVMKDC
jgi:Ca2+-binding EF-hand superfamily protein